mmetsp:Transcript_17973/g.54973  ORF Transcript_17973/g.54973 Transcript_17973/m.54973 type:complete len:324 (-) Transcript_17973:399-1370(-)
MALAPAAPATTPARQSSSNGMAPQLDDTTITAVSGAVSGALATIAKQPVQRIKWIRQVDFDASGKSYKNIIGKTLKQDGILGFFRGSLGSIVRNVPHSMLVYSIYPHAEELVLRGMYGSNAEENRNFAVRFWGGYVTLFGATLLTHPLDTLRVRAAVSSEAERGLWASSRGIVAKEGIMVFYKGFIPTLIGAGPRGAIGFGIFESLKAHTQDWEVCKEHKSLSKFAYGYVAGVLSETFVYPLDTVRRTQQAHGKNHEIGNIGWVRALQHLVRKGGVLSLFNGLAMNLFKNPIGTAVSFAVNDYVKDRLGYVGKNGNGNGKSKR